MNKIYDTAHLSANLKKLIELKSNKDNKKFTASQLAAILNVQRSQIARLTTQNEDIKVENPKLSTLFDIVTFFCNEGINLSLDDLFIKNPNFSKT